MAYYICGYFLSYKTMKEKIPVEGPVHMTSGFRPYVRKMTEMVSTPPNILGATFDEMFRDSRPVTLPSGSEDDEDDNMGVILVRAEGYIDQAPELFFETDGDKLVKRVVEEHLHVELGPFKRVYFTY